jgi:hypothetical protein
MQQVLNGSHILDYYYYNCSIILFVYIDRSYKKISTIIAYYIMFEFVKN